MKKYTLIPVVLAMGIVGLAGCGGGGGGEQSSSSIPTSTPTSEPGPSSSSEPVSGYSFTLGLMSGKSVLVVGDVDKIEIYTSGTPEKTPVYTYTAYGSAVTVSSVGTVEAKKEGTLNIVVTDTANNKDAVLQGISVIPLTDPASGGFNYAAAAGSEAVAKRTEILGSLEKYAMNSHLTGITLFENGGYVKYSERIEMPTTEYITGYGFGILSEGNITSELKSEDNPAHKLYLHSASSSDPLTISEINDTGSQVSDLASYITSSYWGTKMNAAKNGYDWYPVLAKDKVDGKAFNRPIPQEEKNELGLYRKWRIYVKTGAEDGLKYSTLSTLRSSFNNRGVELADYEFKYQALLTGANGMRRGSEMAADQTYGIKGAQQFYNRTKAMTDQDQIDNTWAEMKANKSLGLATGSDSNGSYIDLEILTPIDEFTAMYTLSSSLVSPLPRAFIEAIGGGSIIEGMKSYGNFNDANILDYTLCLGPYTLESWAKRQATVFKQAENWIERTTYPNRHRIKGVKIMIVSNATENPEALYNKFNNGEIDSCGIPTSKLSEEVGKPRVYATKGDSTFKLNVNSCDQETWNYLFGPNGKINKNSVWDVKPWMSNDDFLAGLFYSINRKEFATARGVQPSINYFSDAYLSDPEHGISYNSTDAHKNAVKAYEVYNGEENMYGYNLSKAVDCFKRAVATLKKEGKVKDGETISIHIRWMYKSDETEYGEDIIRYFETAFNDPKVSNGKIKLKVEQDAVTDWQQVYNEYLMKGQFDLGFGAISGNTYNPLNFLEVLKSDNSSGFTLNWGTDTSKVDAKHPLIYDDKNWSFDALWNVSDHGGVVDNGSIVKSVKIAYMETPRKISDNTVTDNLLNGVTIKLPYEFIDVPDVEFTVTGLSIYIVGAGNVDLTFEVKDGYLLVTIPEAKASEINEKIREANKLREEDGAAKPIANAFLLAYYGTYWSVEMNYSIRISGGAPTQNYVSVAKNKDAWDPNN